MSTTDKQIPIIGLTTYGQDERGRYHLPAEYIHAVRRAGGLPLMIAPGERHVDKLLDQLDALIFTGGGDIDPVHYGGRPHETIYGTDAERDRSELGLIAKILHRPEIPALCICRGLQVLNVALGGTLIEHLPEEVGETVRHRKPPRLTVTHPVHIAPGSRLAKVLGTGTVEAVSWHHQAIRTPGAGLQVVARAADGVIEAVELPGRPNVIAVQWHPEISADRDPLQQRLFDVLVEMANSRQSTA